MKKVEKNTKNHLNLTVIGTGYVGLVSGVCLAECGHHVCCVDIDEEKVKSLQSGVVPIYEPGLDVLLEKNINNNHISFTTDLKNGVAHADIIMIAVGTPSNPDTQAPDLKYVDAVALSIAPLLQEGQVVVVKSTSPIGTASRLKKLIQSHCHVNFSMATNPEFLREGSAMDDFMQPDRIVVGIEDDFASKQLEKLYHPFKDDCELMLTDLASAEMIKYAANAFLATKISFINEVSNLCEKVGADVSQVSKGIGLDARIGSQFLEAGPGFGGSCFPKDTLAMAYVGQQAGAHQEIVETVIKVNDHRLNTLHEKILKLFNGSVHNKTIAFWGVTFKPLTDDMRDSPALNIIPQLQSLGAKCVVYDPQGKNQGEDLLPNVIWCESAGEAARNADALCVLTHWPEFHDVDLEEAAISMQTAHLVDFRNMFDFDLAQKSGFISYTPVGRRAWVANLEATHS